MKELRRFGNSQVSHIRYYALGSKRARLTISTHAPSDYFGHRPTPAGMIRRIIASSVWTPAGWKLLWDSPFEGRTFDEGWVDEELGQLIKFLDGYED